MIENPFADIALRDRGEVGRDPFSPEELGAILTVLQKSDHEFIRPIVLAGYCTAMRRGDCCQLSWADVDLEEGFVEVVTSKTRVKVAIPLAPLLADEIRKLLPPKGEFVFEAQHQMYQANPDGMTWRIGLKSETTY